MADIASLSVEVKSKGIRKTSEDLNGLGKSADSAEKKTKSATSAMNKSWSKFTKLSSSAISKFRSSISKVEKSIFSLKSLLLGAGLVVFAKDIFKVAASFEAMENTMIAATGSIAAGKNEMDFVIKLSRQLGLDLDRTAKGYSNLTAAAKGSALAGQQIRDTFTSVARASASLSLSGARTESIIFALGQMISKGVVSMEELRRQIGEHLPGAFVIAAKAMGITTRELDKLVSSGELMTEDFLPKFTVAIEEAFGGGVERASKSARASLNRFATDLKLLKLDFARSGFMDFVIEGMAQLSKSLRDPIIRESLTGISNALGQVGKDGTALMATMNAILTFTKYLAIGFKTVGSVVDIAFAGFDGLYASHIDKTISILEGKLENLKRQQTGGFNIFGLFDPNKSSVTSKINETVEALNKLKAKQSEFKGAESFTEAMDRNVQELNKFILAMDGAKIEVDTKIPELITATAIDPSVELNKKRASLIVDKEVSEKSLKIYRDYATKLKGIFEKAFSEVEKRQKNIFTVQEKSKELVKQIEDSRPENKKFLEEEDAFNKYFRNQDELIAKEKEINEIIDPQARIAATKSLMQAWRELAVPIKDGADTLISFDDAAEKSIEKIKQLAQEVIDAETKQLQTASKLAKDAQNRYREAQTEIAKLEATVNSLDTAVNNLTKSATITLNDGVTAIAKTIEASLSGLINRVNTLLSRVNTVNIDGADMPVAVTYGSDVSTLNLPKFAVGSDFVPKTGLAVVHKGERIIPAKENNEQSRRSQQPSIIFGDISIQLPNVQNVDKRSVDDFARELIPAIQRIAGRQLFGGQNG